MSAPTDLADDVLAARIRAACTAQVADLTVDDASFDPDRPGLDVEGAPAFDARTGTIVELGPRPVPRSRRLTVLVAAVLLVIAGVASVLATRHHPDGKVTTTPIATTTTSTPVLGPGDGSRNVVLAHEPLGHRLEELTVARRPPDVVAARTQLFGAPGGRGAKVLVSIGEVPSEERGGAPVSLRDRTGKVGNPTTLGGDIVTLDWWEHGQTIHTTSSGLTREQVRDFLESLAWRNRSASFGFSPPSGGMVLLAESGRSTAEVTNVLATYRDRSTGSTEGGTIRVQSTTTHSDELTPAFLLTWLLGGPVGSGPVTEVRAYDDRGRSFREGVAGGLDVSITADMAVIDHRTFDALVADLRPVGSTDLKALDREVQSHLDDVPLVAKRKMKPGITVEMRGPVGKRTTCVVIDGNRRCGLPQTAPDPTASWASMRIGTTWYVAAVVEDEPRVEPARNQIVERPVPITTTVRHLPRPYADLWVVFIEVSDDIRAITIWQDGWGFDPERPDQ